MSGRPVHGCAKARGRRAAPLYQIWCAMRARARRPGVRGYEYVGARGCTVAPEWMDFRRFASAVGQKPHDRARLCRIDTFGDFAPGNVYWRLPKGVNPGEVRT